MSGSIFPHVIHFDKKKTPVMSILYNSTDDKVTYTFNMPLKKGNQVSN